MTGINNCRSTCKKTTVGRGERYRPTAAYPDALWQRCPVHFYRNVWTAVPTNKVKLRPEDLRYGRLPTNSLRSALTAVLAGQNLWPSGRRRTTNELSQTTGPNTTTRPMPQRMCEKLWTLPADMIVRFALEAKPNEPRGDIYMSTTGHYLGFIPTLDHPEMLAVNPDSCRCKVR
jgi:hypothetical protein